MTKPDTSTASSLLDDLAKHHEQQLRDDLHEDGLPSDEAVRNLRVWIWGYREALRARDVPMDDAFATFLAKAIDTLRSEVYQESRSEARQALNLAWQRLKEFSSQADRREREHERMADAAAREAADEAHYQAWYQKGLKQYRAEHGG